MQGMRKSKQSLGQKELTSQQEGIPRIAGGVLSGDLKAFAGESGTKEPDSPNWMGELPRMERGQAVLSSSATGWVCSARHRRAQLNTSWYWTLLGKGDNHL